MQVAELEPRLDAILAGITKIGAETDSLIAAVAALRVELEQGGVVPAGVEQKLVAVEQQVQVVDSKVADLVPPADPTAAPAG